MAHFGRKTPLLAPPYRIVRLRSGAHFPSQTALMSVTPKLFVDVYRDSSPKCLGCSDFEQTALKPVSQVGFREVVA